MRTLLVLGLAVVAGACAPSADDASAATALLRPTDPGEPPPAFEAGEVVESVVSPGGAFRVHFTRAGANQVRARDDDGDGTPDDVESTAALYDEALAFYRDELAFRPPLPDDFVTDGNGGDALFDVYLLDFALRADGAYRIDACVAAGACAGYMAQENDFVGYPYLSFAFGTRIVGSHELFHAIQAAYRGNGSVTLGEGTAVWASEQFDPSLEDFEGFVGGYLERPDRSLAIDPAGPVPPFAYGSALFFQFLTERFDQDVVRALWDGVAAAPADTPWVEILDGVLAEMHGTSLEEAFIEFVGWNVRTADRANPAVAYANGADYPDVATEALARPTPSLGLRLQPVAARYRTIALDAPTSYAMVSDTTPSAARLLAFAVDGSEVEALGETELGAIGTAGARAGADLWLVVAHGDPIAEGENVTLCVGSEADLAACAAGPGTDGGITPGGDGAVPADGGAIPPPMDEGCSCRAVGARGGRSGIAVLVSALALACVASARPRARRRR